MKTFLIIFWGLILFALVGYTIVTLRSPKEYSNRIQQISTINPNDKINFNLAANDSLKILNREKLFYMAQLQMAKADSIGLVVNLKDSVVTLILKGVILHRAKISSFDLPDLFINMDLNFQNQIFSNPIVITNQEANTQKQPLKLKKAPKNELEAEQQVSIPDTSLNIPALIKLHAAPYFNIQIRSTNTNQADYAKTIRKAKIENIVNVLCANLKAATKAKVPEYTPEIIIYMNSADMVGIYRALPHSPQMALNWP